MTDSLFVVVLCHNKKYKHALVWLYSNLAAPAFSLVVLSVSGYLLKHAG